MGGAKPGLRREPPRVGEHTREVLRAAGLGEDEIAALARERVIVADDC